MGKLFMGFMPKIMIAMLVTITRRILWFVVDLTMLFMDINGGDKLTKIMPLNGLTIVDITN